ncbi:hypothetical protein [Yersinia ruckeri]|uniref:hypothetical protein n=1 Tax=Yersinia ruckeri TaxID=29486 RepID=UPI002237EB5F|nr:hypothetical protein [Yersinia ruckeri]MCW6609152.1 hypothetical protein [Yersinia ruckeri]MCW6614217.1 hypothetical protein [Yersinia ruckeri]
MKLKTIFLPLLCIALLNGCGVLPQNPKAVSDNWQGREAARLEEKRKQDTVDYLQRLEESERQKKEFNLEHPEVEITGLGQMFSNTKLASLREPFDSMKFLTRYPDTKDMQKLYVKVGNHDLPLSRILISIKEQVIECQRVSAYLDHDIESQCISQSVRGLTNFAQMINDLGTPALTKKAALGEATIGNVIYFDHAARLMRMHNKMCNKQNDDGYVNMVTVAVPCKNFKGAGIN